MTTYAPEVPAHHRHVKRWLLVGIGLAALVFAVALGWSMFQQNYARVSEQTLDARGMIDGANTAFSTGDAAAIPTYYAPDAVIRSFGTNETYTGVKQISALADGSFTAERIAPVTVIGSPPEYATTFVKLTGPDGSQVTTVSVFQTRQFQPGGYLKIVRQWNFLPGTTPPLDNAVVTK